MTKYKAYILVGTFDTEAQAAEYLELAAGDAPTKIEASVD